MAIHAPLALPDGRLDARSLDFEGVRALMQGLGKEDWRALHVYKAIWKQGIRSFDEVEAVSKSARRALAKRAYVSHLEQAARLESQDGTVKYVWRLHDGGYIESVLIPDEDHPGGRRLTLCISSQVGCAMACSFCLTGDLGLKRHLSPGEIAGQLAQVQLDVGRARRVTNVVMMGMGEPLHNLDNLLTAISIMLDENALGLSYRKLTVSTVGLVPAMRVLLEKTCVNLAVSLNATTEEQRLQVMPITRRYSLEELMECCRQLPLRGARRITFEYVMMRGFNDSMEDAQRLGDLMQGVRCKVNLIPYNENPEREIGRPADLTVWRFQDHLVQRGLHTSVRRTRGRDISAACGQLGGAEALARQVQDPSSAWRAEQRAAAQRGEAMRIDREPDWDSPPPAAEPVA